MNSSDLNSNQIKVIQDQLKPSFVYLKGLVERMAERGFHPDDEIFKAASDAFNRVHALNIRLHYLGCDASRREYEAKQTATGKRRSPWGR